MNIGLYCALHHANDISVLDMLTKSIWTFGKGFPRCPLPLEESVCVLKQSSEFMQLIRNEDNRVLIFNNPLLSSGLY